MASRSPNARPLTDTADVAAPAALDPWASWPALINEAGSAWWQLQAQAWQQQFGWWTSLMQGRLPLERALDIAEAEVEHAANPMAALPWTVPVQEATRCAMAFAAAPWTAWAGWGARALPTICGGPGR